MMCFVLPEEGLSFSVCSPYHYSHVRMRHPWYKR